MASDGPADGSFLTSNPAVTDDAAFAKMRDVVESQVAELRDKVTALAARYEKDLTLKHATENENSRDGTVIYCEFEGVACTIDTEAALVGEAGGEAELRKQRLQALDGESLEQALERCEAAGATLAPGFVEFAEACLVKGITLHVLSRGWKPVISHFLRGAGLGHVQVSANHLLVSGDECRWRLCFRDHTPSGHDKAEALRRAQRDLRPARPAAVLLGNFACDLGAAEAKDELVQRLYAARDSELWAAATAAGVPVREFVGWEAFAEEVLQGGAVV
jgi:2-hydroxy-3-keto-5-methylthiopentenyl-1-phosphate phosphatase